MKTKSIVYVILCALLFVGCGKEEEEPDIPVTPRRTVLAYMVSSNLGDYLRSNVAQMKTAVASNALNGGNLVVYFSESKSRSYLFQIKADKNGKVTTDTVCYYNGMSAVTPATMRGVVQDVERLFPAESYGMIFSSHGTSWLPGNYGSLRSFGEENDDHMEITEISEALKGYHFDFMLFDACYMCGIECAYELRNMTDYLLGTPTEVLAHGFPYEDFLPVLFEDEADLQAVAKSFYDYYSNNGRDSYGTVSLIKTSHLDDLASVVGEILSDKTEEDIYALPLQEMQVLEYLTSSAPHMLYDFDDFIRSLATDTQYARFCACMDKAVVCKYTTPYSYYNTVGAKKIEHYSGMSVFVPQQSLAKLYDWYKRLAWYDAVYY